MFGFVYVSFLCVVTVVLIYSNNCAIWILLTNNNCEGLFGSFTPSVKAKVKVVAASYCGTGTGGTTGVATKLWTPFRILIYYHRSITIR